jgi:hypothetical protein
MDVAPKELGELLRNAIYMHSASMALPNRGVGRRRLPHTPNFRATTLRFYSQ